MEPRSPSRPSPRLGSTTITSPISTRSGSPTERSDRWSSDRGWTSGRGGHPMDRPSPFVPPSAWSIGSPIAGSLVSRDGGAPRDVGRQLGAGFLDGPYQYAWAPDGKTLYFTGADTLSTSIFAIEAGSGAARRVTNRPAQRAALSI